MDRPTSFLDILAYKPPSVFITAMITIPMLALLFENHDYKQNFSMAQSFNRFPIINAMFDHPVGSGRLFSRIALPFFRVLRYPLPNFFPYLFLQELSFSMINLAIPIAEILHDSRKVCIPRLTDFGAKND